jgi:hypothetical protein
LKIADEIRTQVLPSLISLHELHRELWMKWYIASSASAAYRYQEIPIEQRLPPPRKGAIVYPSGRALAPAPKSLETQGFRALFA